MAATCSLTSAGVARATAARSSRRCPASRWPCHHFQASPATSGSTSKRTSPAIPPPKKFAAALPTQRRRSKGLDMVTTHGGTLGFREPPAHCTSSAAECYRLEAIARGKPPAPPPAVCRLRLGGLPLDRFSRRRG